MVRGDIPDHAVIGGVPAKVIRRFVPGVGWERADGGPGVKAPSPTIDPAVLAEALDELARQEAAGNPLPPDA